MSLSDLRKTIATIEDPDLRKKLLHEMEGLKDQRFGLVFQDHSPEKIILHGHKVAPGVSRVVHRNDPHGTEYDVIELDLKNKIVEAMNLEDKTNIELPIDDLVVVRHAGDAVYPGMKLVDQVIAEPVEGQDTKPTHVVINSENLHALQALNYTHAGRVDLIYIDPPYNTGNADWKYNDRYVDNDDDFRHSKWLSFMEKRLKTAKTLLKDTGVIVMAIDDNEHHHLRMLADQVFGPKNFISNLVWQGQTNSASNFHSGGVDYMLCYARNRDALTTWKETKPGITEVKSSGTEAWHKSGGDPKIATEMMKKWWKSNKGKWAAGLEPYTLIDESGRVFRPVTLSAPDKPETRSHRALVHPETGKPCAVSSRGWAVSDETMDRLISEGRVLFGKDETTVPNRKYYVDENEFQLPAPTFYSPRTSATKNLVDILGDKRFPFPKDHSVLMRWFRMIAPHDAVIVDFFAGSGSTAEAVIRLNEEDNGTRQAILVTNNELGKDEDKKLRLQGHAPGSPEYEALGVFHHVTKPRIKTVLTGRREDGSKFSDGIHGQSAVFLELTYEDRNDVEFGRVFERVSPLLWIRSGSTGSLLTTKQKTPNYVVSPDSCYAVLFNTDKAAELSPLLHDGIKHVYIVTDSNEYFRSAASAFPSHLAESAVKLYKDHVNAFNQKPEKNRNKKLSGLLLDSFMVKHGEIGSLS
jgi:adenine-specific DNA-methyltransferase